MADWPSHKLACSKRAVPATQSTPTPPPTTAASHSKYSLPKALFGVFSHKEGDCENLFLFLHGFGETERAMCALGQKMAMPKTSVLALRGPEPVLDLGFSWFPLLDEAGEFIPEQPSERRRLEGLSRSVARIHSVVEELVAHGWARKHIFLVGFAQGGTVALDYALSAPDLIGGAASISGGCYLGEAGLAVSSTRGWKQRGVPLLVTHGTRDASLSAAAVAAQVQTVQAFLTLSKVQFHTYPKTDSRISSAEEARDFFAFFAPLFASRLAAMEALAKDGTLIELTPKK